MGKVDRTGQKYNHLTFIRYLTTNKCGNCVWELQCDCGNTTTGMAVNVVNNRKKSCGCVTTFSTRKDLTGQKYGKLTFLRFTGTTKGRGAVWELMCDCGNITTGVLAKVVNGSKVSCGCQIKITSARLGLLTRKFDPVVSLARRCWYTSYKGYPFDLFLTMSQLPCDYCGRLPHRKRKVVSCKSNQFSEIQTQATFTWNGLDRIDSTKGHIEGNVVPCCWDCNRMKSDMSRDEFIAHIKRMYDHSVHDLTVAEN